MRPAQSTAHTSMNGSASSEYHHARALRCPIAASASSHLSGPSGDAFSHPGVAHLPSADVSWAAAEFPVDETAARRWNQPHSKHSTTMPAADHPPLACTGLVLEVGSSRPAQPFRALPLPSPLRPARSCIPRIQEGAVIGRHLPMPQPNLASVSTSQHSHDEGARDEHFRNWRAYLIPR